LTAAASDTAEHWGHASEGVCPLLFVMEVGGRHVGGTQRDNEAYLLR